MSLKAFILILLLCTPTYAFVDRLSPNEDGQHNIGCHDIKAVVLERIAGTVTSDVALKNLFEKGVPYTAAENTDFTNLRTLIDAQLTTADQTLLALRLESLCMVWERGLTTALDTPNEYRSLLGIPTQ